MAVNYNNNLKNTRMNAVINEIGNGGKLVIGTSSLSGGSSGVLATFDLPSPPASVANGVMTIRGVPLASTATGTGTAARAEFRSSSGVVVDGLTVGTASSNPDVVINATNISSGQAVQISSASITHS